VSDTDPRSVERKEKIILDMSIILGAVRYVDKCNSPGHSRYQVTQPFPILSTVTHGLLHPPCGVFALVVNRTMYLEHKYMFNAFTTTN
jgi:hypothetical protein